MNIGLPGPPAEASEGSPPFSRTCDAYTATKSVPSKKACDFTSAAPCFVPSRASTSDRRSREMKSFAVAERRSESESSSDSFSFAGGPDPWFCFLSFGGGGGSSGGHAMVPARMFSKIFTGVSAWNGGTPTRSSNTTTPSAHQSTSGPYGSHRRTSGAR